MEACFFFRNFKNLSKQVKKTMFLLTFTFTSKIKHYISYCTYCTVLFPNFIYICVCVIKLLFQYLNFKRQHIFEGIQSVSKLSKTTFLTDFPKQFFGC